VGGVQRDLVFARTSAKEDSNAEPATNHPAT
jgi:hypothetical protein